MRIVDLLSPIGKGQRGMIVSPPKAGKTTLLKEVALSVQKREPDMHLLILLIDERPGGNRYQGSNRGTKCGSNLLYI